MGSMKKRRDNRPTIVPVGGFLGAGKTSLIVAAARMLGAEGVKAAALFNDQGAELVDTRFAEASGIESSEVTGGCFCCRLSDLVRAAEELRAHMPEVIFAEAVGSCTDISATVLQPLKAEHARHFRVAPYTVLVDPERAGRWLDPALDADLAFLFREQIAEADVLCYSKADLFPDYAALPGVAARYVSSRTGEGVRAWLDDVLAGRFRTGGRILEIDYERYARAEASLAWLNCAATLRPEPALPPAQVVGPLMDRLDEALAAEGMEIAHLKVMDETPSGWLKAALVRRGGEPSLEGGLDASPAARHRLLVNVRAAGAPETLRRAVEAQLGTLAGRLRMDSMECFSPSPPKPEKRFDRVVEAEE